MPQKYIKQLCATVNKLKREHNELIAERSEDLIKLVWGLKGFRHEITEMLYELNKNKDRKIANRQSIFTLRVLLQTFNSNFSKYLDQE